MSGSRTKEFEDDHQCPGCRLWYPVDEECDVCFMDEIGFVEGVDEDVTGDEEPPESPDAC